MASRRRALAFCAVLALALVGAAPALAVSPQTIYKDLADNGRLDRRYSQADLARAFNVERVMGTDQRKTAQVHPMPAADNAASKRSGRRVPFSGLDLALLTFGGGPLLLIGVGLRRRIAPAASQAGVAG